MRETIHYKIFSKTESLPENWDDFARLNIFLSKRYLQVLEKSAPENMTCFFVGIFKGENLCGIAISQFLDLNKLESFGERDRCVKTTVRNFIFKTFSSHVLFMGNNMLTGENSYFFDDTLDKKEGFKMLKKSSDGIREILRNKGFKVHLLSFKDFYEDTAEFFNQPLFQPFFKFSTQPNMVLEVRENWNSFDDYIADLSKKYRDQLKRSRKKSEEIIKRKMDLQAIVSSEEILYDLYFHVAKNAPFNTFFLAKNHFSTLKEILKDDFLLYGYFLDDKLIGFSTLIKNGEVMETYFLGYDDQFQKEKMLYLNMLYDMVAFSINNNFKKIIFGRTALEIKSSVGAKPQPTFGFISHSNRLINAKIDKIFSSLEPKTEWQERNPFK